MKEMIVKRITDSIDVKKLLLKETFIKRIEQIAQTISTAYGNGNKVLLCGNGGSASDAQHIEGELVGRFQMERRALPAIAITANSSIITSVGNDYEFNRIFQRQVEAHGVCGDILIGISTGGTSPNVIAAVEQAKQSGLTTIGLLGKTGGELKELVDIPLVIPSNDTPRIQESHILIGHIICDLVEKSLFDG